MSVTRREFISGAVAVGLSANDAEALSPSAAAPNFHNGHKSQLGIIQANVEMAWVDVDKTGGWTINTNLLFTRPQPKDLDANGYPLKSVATTSYLGKPSILTMSPTGGAVPSQKQRPGNYHRFVQGKHQALYRDQLGSHSVTVDTTGANGNVTIPGITGFVRELLYRFTDPNFKHDLSYQIINLQTSYESCTLTAMIHEDDLPAWKAGLLETPKFKTQGLITPRAKEIYSQIGCLRFMDVNFTNANNAPDWSHRTPVGYASYVGHYYRPQDCAKVDIVAADNWTFTLDFPGFVLRHGAVVHARPSKNTVARTRITDAIKGTTSTIFTTQTAHPFSIGQRLHLQSNTNWYFFPNWAKIIEVPDDTHFTVDVPSIVNVNGTVTAGQRTVTNIDTTWLHAQMTVSGAGIPANTTVRSVDVVGTSGQITLSANATANGPQTLTIQYPGAFNARNVSGYAFVPTTLNVNGTGEKILLNEGGAPVGLLVSSQTSGGPNPQGQLLNTLWATFIYNEALDGWMTYQARTALQVHHGIASGAPYELLIQICNQVGAHPWFNVPYLCGDGPGGNPKISDFTMQLATLCKNNLAAGLIPRFEYSNELWNFLFVATGYAATRQSFRSGEQGVSSWSDDYYGGAVSKVGQAVSAVYGDDRTKYMMMLGVQTFVGIIGAPTTSGREFDRFNATYLVSQTGGRASTQNAYKWVTHLCLATYWNFPEGDPRQNALAASFADAIATNDPAAAMAVLNQYVNINNLTKLAETYRGWMNWYKAAFPGFPIGLAGYEGGYSVNLAGGPVGDLRYNSKWATDIVKFEEQNYANFEAAGGVFYPQYYSMFPGNGFSVWDPDYYTVGRAFKGVTLSTTFQPRWQAILNRG